LPIIAASEKPMEKRAGGDAVESTSSRTGGTEPVYCSTISGGASAWPPPGLKMWPQDRQRKQVLS